MTWQRRWAWVVISSAPAAKATRANWRRSVLMVLSPWLTEVGPPILVHGVGYTKGSSALAPLKTVLWSTACCSRSGASAARPMASSMNQAARR